MMSETGNFRDTRCPGKVCAGENWLNIFLSIIHGQPEAVV